MSLLDDEILETSDVLVAVALEKAEKECDRLKIKDETNKVNFITTYLTQYLTTIRSANMESGKDSRSSKFGNRRGYGNRNGNGDKKMSAETLAEKKDEGGVIDFT